MTKYNSKKTFLCYLFFIFSILLSSCVLHPYDGQKVVASTSDPVSFSGTMISANAPVHLHFYNFTTSQFEFFTTVYSAPSHFWTTTDGDKLYSWSYAGVLPARFWQAGMISGAKGKLLFKHDETVLDGVLITFRRDWVNCMFANPVFTDFLLNCSSPNTPEATFTTYDFDDGLI